MWDDNQLSDLALILCHGEPPERDRLGRWRARASLFIAADGGGNVAASLGVRPDYVVGDLDSYDRTSFSDLEPIRLPDQESNDLEKALELALLVGMRRAIVLGGTGLRIDHALKNLSVMKRFSQKLQVDLEDRYFRIVLLCQERRRLLIRGRPGQRVSLFPLSGRVMGIVTEGLQWPLIRESLENGIRDGSSNRMTGETALVAIQDGDLIVMVAHPDDPQEDRRHA